MQGFCQQSAIFLNTDSGITGSESHLPLQKSPSDRVTLHGKEIFSVKERKLIDSSGIQIMKQQKVQFLEVIDHVIFLYHSSAKGLAEGASYYTAPHNKLCFLKCVSKSM